MRYEDFYDTTNGNLSSRIPANRGNFRASDAIIFSGEVAYSFRDNFSFVLGADNLFATMSPKVRDIDFTAATSNRYLTSTAYSPNGRFLYGRIQYDF